VVRGTNTVNLPRDVIGSCRSQPRALGGAGSADPTGWQA